MVHQRSSSPRRAHPHTARATRPSHRPVRGLGRIKTSLRADVLDRAGDRLFAQAKTRHPSLAEHGTVLSVLGALGASSSRRWAEKDALTRALVEEFQRQPHAFWGAALLLAYSPMLSRLRGRILGDAFCSDDLDQIVVSTFLEVVDDYPLQRWPDRICLRLRQHTERRVFRALRDEQRAREIVIFDEPEAISLREQALVAGGEEIAWPEVKQRQESRPDPKEAAAAVAFLVTHASEVLDADRIDMLVATLVRGERLSDYVDRVFPSQTSAERRRTYQRIKRRHSRALGRLREAVAPFRCPHSTPQGALSTRSPNRPEGGHHS